METVTVSILIIIALGIFAFAAWGVVSLQHREEQYAQLCTFIDECENTKENWEIATDRAIELIKSKMIAERDIAALNRKINNKFLLPWNEFMMRL